MVVCLSMRSCDKAGLLSPLLFSWDRLLHWEAWKLVYKCHSYESLACHWTLCPSIALPAPPFRKRVLKYISACTGGAQHWIAIKHLPLISQTPFCRTFAANPPLKVSLCQLSNGSPPSLLFWLPAAGKTVKVLQLVHASQTSERGLHSSLCHVSRGSGMFLPGGPPY